MTAAATSPVTTTLLAAGEARFHLLLPVRLTGREADDIARSVRAALRAADGQLLDVDCGDVEVVDLRGVALLVALSHFADERALPLVLSHPSGALAQALRTTGLDRVLPLAGDRFPPGPWVHNS